jgi:hypothetical protein
MGALTIQLLMPIASFAQTDQGRITGVVCDQNKAVIAAATVAVKNERTGEERTITTNDQGSYLVAGLKPSVYTVRTVAPGFGTSEMTGLQVLVGDTLTIDIEIKPSGTSESVTIVATEEAGLETDSATMGVNVNPREVQALPFNGRQLSQLYLQAPGPTVTLQPGQPFTTALAGSAFGVANRTVERTVGLGTNRQIQFALRLNF